MSRHLSTENPFLTAPPTRLFWANALPMMLIMMMSGLLSLVDAIFLGRYVGADALAAVSLVFPLVMVTIALSTLVSGGMSSLLARHLGARQNREAQAVFARAHGLALAIALVAIGLFALFGAALVQALAGDQPRIAAMARTYLGITILATPIQFWLGVHGDTWRNEGRAGVMAMISVAVTLANIALNYLLIVRLDLGVAGSAWGSLLAQALGLAVLVGLRMRAGRVPLSALLRHRWLGGWRPLLALGAPMSLSFIGIALVSATVIATLRATAGDTYADVVAAYGVVTRIFSFTFLPIMATGLAAQSIVGNNVGAGLHHRATAVLRLSLGVALVWCVTVEAVLLLAGPLLGAGFVADPAVIALVGAILGKMALLYAVQGPILVLAMYFQALGRAGHAALLTLVRPFVLTPLAIVGLSVAFDAHAIWFAFPLGDAAIALVALALVLGGSLRPAPAWVAS